MAGFKERAANNDVTRADINDSVMKSGGLDYTHIVSRKYYNKSLKIIEELCIDDGKREKLKSILDKAYRI
jgi:heptaprenyl diphosphate synthase